MQIAAVGWLRHYDRAWLGRDIVGGITAGTVVVPQAMAYATIAHLPVQVGLYTCMVPMVVYALLGGSRTLSVSTTSTVAALTASSLVAAGVAVDADGSPGAIAALTILVGLILLIARLLRLGSVIENISDATLTGLKVGVGLTVAAGQLPKLLGVPSDPDASNFIPEIRSVLRHLGDISVVTLVFSLATILVLLAINRFAPRVPGPLVVVVLGILVVAVGSLGDHGLTLVAPVPSGLPTPVWPTVSDVSGLLPGAFAIAIMAFLETAAVAGSVRRRGEPAIDNNQELVAIGAANILGGLFRAMPAAGGFSQTAISQRAGSRTQLSELVTVVVAIACAVFLGGVLSDLPEATLASMVMIAVIGLISPKTYRRLWRLDRVEFWVAAITALLALLFGMLVGVLAGVVLTLVLVLWELGHLTITELQPTPADGADEDVRLVGSHTRPEPGLLILRVDGPLFTANVRSVARQVESATIDRGDVRTVVLDLSAVGAMSVMVMDQLSELSRELGERGATMWVAALPPRAFATVRETPRWATIEATGIMFPTSLAAVRAFRAGARPVDAPTAEEPREQ